MAAQETRFTLEDGTDVAPALQGIEPLNLASGVRVRMKESARDDEYEIVNWHYAIAPDRLALVVVLRRVVPTWFQRRTQDQQVTFAYVLIVLTLVPAGILAALYYSDRTQFMALVGWYCRNAVAWCLFALGVLMSTRLPGWTVGPTTVLGTYLGLLFPLAGLIGALAWAQIARPGVEPAIWPADYAAYAEKLLDQLNPVLPTVVAALPWLALVVKLAGLTGVGTVFEKLSSIKK